VRCNSCERTATPGTTSARSRAYRSGEDGLAGFCDDKQRLCFGLALWNERDPILKERLFGPTNQEGRGVCEGRARGHSDPNHGLQSRARGRTAASERTSGV